MTLNLKEVGGKLAQGAKNLTNKKLSIRLKIGLIIGFVVLILVCSFTLLTISAYKNPTDFGRLSPILKHMPYPAMFVNGNVIFLPDWQFEFQGWKKVGGLQGAEQTPPDSVIKDDVTNKMTYDILIKQLAKKYKVSVTSDDFNKDITEIAPEYQGTKDQFYQDMQTMFGWSKTDFEKHILYYSMLSTKISDAMNKNDDLWVDCESRAQKILDQINNGGNFEELAKTNSQDTSTAPEGGKLSPVGKGDFVPEFEKAALALKVGEVSGLVRTQYGYHIIKLLDLKIDKAGELESYQVEHILLRPSSLTDELQKLKTDAKVWNWVK